MVKWLIFSNLVVAKTLDYNEDQSTWPAERDLRAAPFPRSKFTQIFQTILHRDHDLLSFHNRTRQLQPDGQVRQVVREPLAKALSVESGLSLSVEDVKLLIHNTVMVQRILSTFGKTPNFNLNQEIFKELLFYGVKSAA